jgi:hypothetical protein
MGGDVCDVGRCQTDPGQKEKCELEVALCIAGEVANEEKCIAAGVLLFCSEAGTGGTGGGGGTAGSGGVGGTGGDGGTGGTGGVAYCDQGLCADDEMLQGDCQAAVVGCIAEAVNEEECVAAAILLFCTEPDAGLLCDEGDCAAEGPQQDACKLLVGYCIAEEPRTDWPECFAFAQEVICGPDGGGGTGGSGGMGGTGGTGGAPDPDIFCDHDVCETNPDRKTACEVLLAYCIAEEPRMNWDECFAFALVFICEDGL